MSTNSRVCFTGPACAVAVAMAIASAAVYAQPKLSDVDLGTAPSVTKATPPAVSAPPEPPMKQPSPASAAPLIGAAPAVADAPISTAPDVIKPGSSKRNRSVVAGSPRVTMTPSVGGFPANPSIEGRSSRLSQIQEQINEADKLDELDGKRLSRAQKAVKLREMSANQQPTIGLRGDIRVVGIEGALNSLAATLRFAAGDEIEVRNGDILSDGTKVVSITRSTVSMKRGSSTMTIPVSFGKVSPSDRSSPKSVFVPQGEVIPAPRNG